MQHDHIRLGRAEFRRIQHKTVLHAVKLLLIEETLLLHAGHVENVQLGHHLLHRRYLAEFHPFGLGFDLMKHILGQPQLVGGDQHHPNPFVARHRLDKRMHRAAKFQIAAEADRQVIQPPLLALDRQQVGERLRRVAVAAVPGVDDRDTGILRTDQRRPLLEMAHGDNVGEATNHPDRIGDRFALRHRRRSGIRKTDDAAAELQHGRSETQPRAGRRLVEERRKFFALAGFAVFTPIGNDVFRQGDDLPDLGDRQIRRVD